MPQSWDESAAERAAASPGCQHDPEAGGAGVEGARDEHNLGREDRGGRETPQSVAPQQPAQWASMVHMGVRLAQATSDVVRGSPLPRLGTRPMSAIRANAKGAASANIAVAGEKTGTVIPRRPPDQPPHSVNVTSSSVLPSVSRPKREVTATIEARSGC